MQQALFPNNSCTNIAQSLLNRLLNILTILAIVIILGKSNQIIVVYILYVC
jgi:hypothetical protein